MTDPFTLDQLRTLLVVVEEGSFSAAARKIRRVQSAVSQSMGNLERDLGLTLWRRDSKTPTLTDDGRSVLALARRVCAEADALRALASRVAGGLESTVKLCVDALFPLSALADVCSAFALEFPAVDLRVETELMSVVVARVVDGAATLGVVTPTALPPTLTKRRLAPIRMIPVVAARHPLAAIRGTIPMRSLASVVQIVLSERAERGTEEQAVLADRTWRIADLHTKHALLRAGLGWGNLPEHLVRDDLRAGVLVRIRPEAWSEDEHTLMLSAVRRSDAQQGPAHRWLMEHLPAVCEAAVDQGASRVSKKHRS